MRLSLAIASLSVVLALSIAACGAKTGLEVPVRDAGASIDARVSFDAARDGCDAGVEICNDLDDDCDGAIDDGIACFFLDGAPLEAIETSTCGAAWYSYDAPDPQSANPRPDIRITDGVVVAVQHDAGCEGASIAVIADLPMDGSGGELRAAIAIDPPGAARMLVADEPMECALDDASGVGSCTWRWQICCTDGVLLGPITRDACVTLVLDGAVGVASPVVLDGPSRPIARRYGEPMEICARIRAAVR